MEYSDPAAVALCRGLGRRLGLLAVYVTFLPCLGQGENRVWQTKMPSAALRMRPDAPPLYGRYAQPVRLLAVVLPFCGVGVSTGRLATQVACSTIRHRKRQLLQFDRQIDADGTNALG